MGEPLKGRYVLESKLGAGAMGMVYRARDNQTGDYVAIKTISKEFAADEDYRKRFTREAAALRKLKHPNIVGYVDTFSIGGQGFLVTEFLSGGTLRRTIHQGNMPDGVFKNIALKVIDAVASAHEMGIIHRDLKPENILLTATSEPKVGDFGLARLDGLSTMTSTGTIMGTISYMPPEAFDTFVKVDHRMDIWALGVIMFEMLTGSLPFRAKTQTEIIAAILTDKPILLSSMRPDLPSGWTAIISQCLEKDMNMRYQSARELQVDLQSDQSGVALAKSENNFQYMGVALEPVAALDGIIEDSAPPAKGEYQLQFIKSEAPTLPDSPADLQVRAKARPRQPIEPLRRVKDLQDRDFDAPTKPNTFGMLIFAGLFVYGGMAVVILGGALALIGFTQGEEGMGVTFQTLSAIQAIGALLFGIGLFFEIFAEDEMWRRLTIAGAAIGAGIIWFFFMSGVLFPVSFFATLFGTMCFLVLMAGYMQYKRGI